MEQQRNSQNEGERGMKEERKEKLEIQRDRENDYQRSNASARSSEIRRHNLVGGKKPSQWRNETRYYHRLTKRQISKQKFTRVREGLHLRLTSPTLQALCRRVHPFQWPPNDDVPSLSPMHRQSLYLLFPPACPMAISISLRPNGIDHLPECSSFYVLYE